MLQEKLKNILETEEKVEREKENAILAARQKEHEAELNAKAAVEDAVKRAEQELFRLDEDTKARGRELTESIENEAFAECERIASQAAGNMEKAADFIKDSLFSR